MKTTQISLRIILIFSVIIFASLIPDYFHDFFGDWKCEGRVFHEQTRDNWSYYSGCNYTAMQHIAQWHWGYRHWMFFAMGIILFIVQVVSLVKSLVKDIE